MPDRTFDFIDTQPVLDAFVERVGEADQVILDTEADSFHHYFEKVCLLQFNVDRELVLVDPLCGLDLQPLLEVLAEHRLILHGADYDLRLLRAGYNWRPHAGIFDTTIAAQLLGIEAFGLSSLVERYANVKLPKGDTRSDWSARPLSEDQLNYAVDDVRYLEVVVERLREELAAKGRLEWHEQSCEGLIEATAEDREQDPETVWRIKGSHKMSPRQLAFLRALWHWRDREARKVDRPAYMILGNRPLIALTYAVDKMGKGNEFPSDFRLPRNVRGRRFAELKEAIGEAAELSPEAYPGEPQGEREYWSRALAAKLKSLKNRLAKTAEELGIDAPVIASRSSLSEIVRERPSSLEACQRVGSLQPWQAGLVYPLAREILDLPDDDDDE